MKTRSTHCCNREQRLAGAVLALASLALSACDLQGRGPSIAFTPASADTIVLHLDKRLGGLPALTTPLQVADELQYQHKFPAAETVLNEWLSAHPADAAALLQRSQLRVALGNPQAALADCMRAAPRLSALAASACQAQALAALGDRDQARQIVERVLAQETGSNAEISWASGIAAELAEKSGDLVGAEARLQRALDSAGGAHYPRVAYAEFLLRRQRYHDAWRLLEVAEDSSSVMRLRRLALEKM
jgi:tetratricopeptide (TPR) repeat protein